METTQTQPQAPKLEAVPPEVQKMLADKAPAVAPDPEAKKNDFEKTDAELELTEDEKVEAPASFGVRGQIKKLMRTFREDFSRVTARLEEAVKFLTKQQNEFQHSVVTKLEQIDKKFMNLYRGLIREIMYPIDKRIVVCDTGIKALLDYVADKFFVTYQSHSQFAQELVALRNRVASLEHEVKLLKGEQSTAPEVEEHVPPSQERDAYINGFRSDVENLRANLEAELRRLAEEHQKKQAQGAQAPAQPEQQPVDENKSQGEEVKTDGKQEESGSKEEARKEETGKESEVKPEATA